MNVKQVKVLAVILASFIALLCAGSAVAGQDEMKGSKKTNITLSKPAQVGDVTLPAGQYVFQHLVSGGQHIAQFVGPQGETSKKTVKVRCTNEPLKQKATQTSVVVESVGGVDKVTRIEIAGEDVAHVL
jgi:hypothetical protein